VTPHVWHVKVGVMIFALLGIAWIVVDRWRKT
jgi:hypothetical protein